MTVGLTPLISFFQLWILPAFGCRPQYDNGLEQETFGFSMWTTVLNFAIPLNLFYRMHSVASLFEVFRRVWQNRRWMTMPDNMHRNTCHHRLHGSVSERRSTVQEAVWVTLWQTWKQAVETNKTVWGLQRKTNLLVHVPWRLCMTWGLFKTAMKRTFLPFILYSHVQCVCSSLTHHAKCCVCHAHVITESIPQPLEHLLVSNI